MFKNKKNGFFLSETIVIIAIVSVVLLGTFKLFSSVYTKYKEGENYNTVNATNSVVQLRKFYQSTEFDYNSLLNGSYYVDLTNSTEYQGEYYENLKQTLKIDKVYLIDMTEVFNGTNINVFDTSLRRYLKTMKATESEVMLVAIIDGNKYGSTTVAGGQTPALVGDATNEYIVTVPLNGTFKDPGYTNWSGIAPTTTWEPALNTALEGTYYLKYNFDGFLLRRKVIVTKATYEYTGSVQTFTVPITGYYFVELYGAQGGESLYSVNYNGGNGGYTSGYIYLTKGEVLYIYVGGKGQKSFGTSSSVLTINGNGYNGGGYAAFAPNNSDKGGGGGATDIRYFGTTTPTTSDLSWNSTLGLNSRIMVAGGGGGSSSHASAPSYSGTGGQGGNPIGGSGIYANTTCYAYGTGGTQTAGGGTPACPVDGQSYIGNGAFGIGNTPYTAYNTNGATAGGGGGYYGGGGGYHAPAGGGSSFISGYAGVNAITSSSSTTATNNTKHYSGKYFINGNMASGINTGHGKANITYYGTDAPTKINTKINNVRYIKDCVTGDNVNPGNAYWVEIQALKDGMNVAYNKSVIGSNALNTYHSSTYSVVTNGIITNDRYEIACSTEVTTAKCVTVDLGQTYNLDEITVWHLIGLTANNNITSVSSDNSNWTTVNATSETETSRGKRISAYTESYDYVYTGAVQTFTVQNTGLYKIELWGAQGNYGGYYNVATAGKGAYTTGEIYLTQGTVLYLYVGSGGMASINGGYNGGGNSGTYNVAGGGGGGSTDVRLVGGLWSGTGSLISRIMVASGGGGAGSSDISLGNGGGLSGENSRATSYQAYGGNGGTQTSGGAAPSNYSGIAGLTAGAFGYGGNGNRSITNGWGGGGGGGYNGGSGGSGAGDGQWAGGGGSSFISGYTGCNAVNASGSYTSQPNHYSNYIFSNSIMIAGSSSMPNTSGGSEIGHSGNGFARITYLRNQ